VRALLEHWRDRITFEWHLLDKGAVVFYSALPLPFAFFACLVYYVHQADVETREQVAAVVAREQAAVVEAREQAAVVATRDADIRCLAENVYHEARGEPLEGQYAVAEVTMNRVGSTRFPKSVCEVVHEQRWDPIRGRYVGAFSWTELERLRQPRGAAWQRAVAVATAVYDGAHSPRVPNALFYHANHIEPSWARASRRVATIGRHVFYR
jgi:spore germination cell wall hydrolase CwlJ-like protein